MIRVAQIILRFHVPLLGRLGPPVHGLAVILLHAQAAVVVITQIMFRLRIAGFRRRLKQLSGARITLRDTLAGVVVKAEAVFRLRVALVRRLIVPDRRIRVALRHAAAKCVGITKVVLRVGVAAGRRLLQPVIGGNVALPHALARHVHGGEHIFRVHVALLGGRLKIIRRLQIVLRDAVALIKRHPQPILRAGVAGSSWRGDLGHHGRVWRGGITRRMHRGAAGDRQQQRQQGEPARFQHGVPH